MLYCFDELYVAFLRWSKCLQIT